MSIDRVDADWSIVGATNDTSLDVASNDPDIQFALCHESENRDAAAYFIINFAKTMDEDMGGAIRSIAPKQVTLRVIREFDFKDPRTLAPLVPANLHVKKSRRMLVTWLLCGYFLYKLQFSSNFTGLLISKDEPSVDDGGLSSTTDSMFGRLRFMHDHLPNHIRRPVSFSFMRARSGSDDGYIMGRAPTVKAGRGSGVQRVGSDENAHQENAEAIHVAIDPMCKDGKIYASTTNGPTNLFAQIDKKQLDGWRFLDVGWEHDPEKTVGIRRTVTDRERDRFGDYVSPYLERATRSLIDDGDVAQEYGRKYNKSRKGLIFREFSRDRHVRRAGTLPYDPAFPIAMGIDFGMARKTCAVIAQPKPHILSVISVYMGEHRNAPDNARALAARLRELGYRRPFDEVDCIPDPSAMNEETGSGMALWAWYRAVGFTAYRAPLIIGPDSVMTGNSVMRWIFSSGLIEFAEECGEDYFEALENYRLPVDKTTGEVKSNIPVHDMACHPADGTRYLGTGFYTAEDIEVDWSSDLQPRSVAPRGEGELLDRAGRTMREIRGGEMPVRKEGYTEDDDDFDPDDDASFNSGVGERTLSSTLHGMRF